MLEETIAFTIWSTPMDAAIMEISIISVDIAPPYTNRKITLESMLKRIISTMDEKSMGQLRNTSNRKRKSRMGRSRGSVIIKHISYTLDSLE